jgi:hypothetical protein
MNIKFEYDMVIFNGVIYSIDPNESIYESAGVKNGRIVALGEFNQIKNCIGENTTVVDLKGKTVLPGFIDAHSHILIFGVNLMNINASTPPNESIEKIQNIVKKKSLEKGTREWIIGWGYDDTKLKDKRHPNRWDLDKATLDRPVVITRQCGHTLTANSKALEIAGINSKTQDPEGGKIERDPVSGEPTGVLHEKAKDLVNHCIPPYTIDDLTNALILAGEKYTMEGITSTHEAALGFTNGENEFIAFHEAKKNAKLPVRIYLMIVDTYIDDLIKIGIKTGYGNNELKFGPIKLFVDGGFSGKTAAVEEPYIDDYKKGILVLTQNEINKKVEKAHMEGFQLAVHAIGDRAINATLNAFERALRNKPVSNHRHRIEHCTLADPSIQDRIKKLGIIPVPQPAFLYYLGDSYKKNIGEKRMRWVFPINSFLNKGLKVPGSSDRPVVNGSPLQGIKSAITRNTLAGKIISPEEKISILEAIKMYTIYPAYAAFEENIKGSIEIGKFADMIVLSNNIFEMLPDDIPSIEIEKTIIGGRIVYEKR